MNNLPLIEFNPKLPRLTKNQKDVLKLLVEAGRLITPVYLEQEKQLKENGNFYPKGVSKQELDKAAKKDSSILSPYTVVEKVDNKLITIPYHIKYAELLKSVADRLIEASRIIEDKAFAHFLRLQAKALLEGSYEEAIAAELKMEPYILDISIGPMEHFDNQLFFAKAAYHCWIGVMDTEGTRRLQSYRNVILSATRKALVSGERIDNHEKVKAKTIDVLIFAGFMAQTKFVGMTFPQNLKLIEKHGSDVTIFNQINDLRMEEQIIPTFNKIFSPGFREGFDFEDLRRASLRYVALHELAHNYLYYKNAKNLGDLLPFINELAATVLGMKIAGSLLLKGIITDKQLESMIVAFICRSFDLIQKSKKSKFVSSYPIGGLIFINFMVKHEALKQHNGLTIPNFMKIFVSLHELSLLLESLLSSGTRKDAESFVKKYT